MHSSDMRVVEQAPSSIPLSSVHELLVLGGEGE
jgi:hypothetical protein